MAATIDAELILCENKDTAASVTSEVLDLGRNKVLKPLYVDVKLTQGVTAGRVKSVELQTSADEAFTTPISEMTVSIGKTADQQKCACQLAQFFAAIQPQGKGAAAFLRQKEQQRVLRPGGLQIAVMAPVGPKLGHGT